MPKALAAALIARSAFLGSTAVPRSVVKTRPGDSALERPRTKNVRRATSPFDAREVLSVVATSSLKVVDDGVPVGFCCWCSVLGGGA